MNKLFTLAMFVYHQLISKGSYLQSAILLIIRLAWGWQLLESGHAHLADVEGTARNFADWGIPMPTLNVYLAGGTEMIGGALLMLGLATRLVVKIPRPRIPSASRKSFSDCSPPRSRAR